MSILTHIFSQTVYAAESSGLVQCGKGADPCKFSEFIPLLVTIFNYLIILVVPLAVLGIGVGGVMMIVGSASEQTLTQGKEALKYSVIGLVVAVASWLIVNTILVGLGATDFTNPLK